MLLKELFLVENAFVVRLAERARSSPIGLCYNERVRQGDKKG